MNDWDKLVTYARKGRDFEMKRMIQTVGEFGAANIPRLVDMVKERAQGRP